MRGCAWSVRRSTAMPIFQDTYRTTVAPADCDHLGHMNVQHYFAAVSDGMFAMMVALGLGPEEIRRRQLSFAVVRAETDFHRELRAGDVVALEFRRHKAWRKVRHLPTPAEECRERRNRNDYGIQVRAARSGKAAGNVDPRRHSGSGIRAHRRGRQLLAKASPNQGLPPLPRRSAAAKSLASCG